MAGFAADDFVTEKQGMVPAGQPGGPPAERDRRIMWGMPLDARTWMVEVERHPERLIPELQALIDKFTRQAQEQQAAKPKK